MHKQIFYVMTMLLVPSVLWASEHHEGINWWGIGSEYRETPALGWYTLTFVIFAVGLVYFVKKPLNLYLEARSNDIRRAIDEARIAKEEANQKLRAYENRLADLDLEIAKMKEDFQRQGVLEKARLKEEADKMALQITKDTDEVIKAEFQHAMLNLKKEISQQVVMLASKEIENHVTRNLDDKIKNDFIREVDQVVH